MLAGQRLGHAEDVNVPWKSKVGHFSNMVNIENSEGLFGGNGDREKTQRRS